jgi:hypothetical protein
MTDNNWLAMIIIGMLGVMIYIIATRPTITPEERKSMEEEWWG